MNEDTDLVLSGANALSISDVDSARQSTVTLSVGSGSADAEHTPA